MFKDIRQITYRGSLKSCNYSCFYCPFHKNIISKEELINDEKQLKLFLKKLDDTKFNNSIELLFTPYGEALIHNYYKSAINELSKKNYVNKVGCQTNLSFDVDNWLGLDADFSKIYIWATFHPTMISVEDFVKKVERLSEIHYISVGVVGNPDDIDIIRKLRKLLPINVYMWINAMDGLGREYTKEEVDIFLEIDPNFMFEINSLKNYNCSCAKEHIFIESDGKVYSCNRNKKTIGDIYKTDHIIKNLCKGTRCDCYLSYSHTYEFLLNSFISENNLFRTPYKVNPEIIFFDIDGTLKEDREDLIKVFSYISKKIPIYLATELPEEIALRKINFLEKYISGGVFGGGSHIVDYENKLEHIEYIDNTTEETLYKIIGGNKKVVYSKENKIYRLVTNKKFNDRRDSCFDNIDIIQQDRTMVSIVKKGCNKLSGIEIICNNLNIDLGNVMCVGNDINDIIMLKNCGYGVAVLKSNLEVKKYSDYHLNVAHIPYII